MAKDAVDLAVLDLQRPVNECVTEKLPLIGADGFFALQQQISELAQGSSLSEETISHLLNRYGSLIEEILQIVREDPEMAERVTPDLPYLKAEILHAVSHEGALSVEDVLLRRTRISFEAGDSGASIADVVAEIIAPVLKWNSAEQQKSVTAFIELITQEDLALREVINS
jgi:glycerol-3-phosphate dehydrogenase